MSGRVSLIDHRLHSAHIQAPCSRLSEVPSVSGNRSCIRDEVPCHQKTCLTLRTNKPCPSGRGRFHRGVRRAFHPMISWRRNQSRFRRSIRPARWVIAGHGDSVVMRVPVLWSRGPELWWFLTPAPKVFVRDARRGLRSRRVPSPLSATNRAAWFHFAEPSGECLGIVHYLPLSGAGDVHLVVPELTWRVGRPAADAGQRSDGGEEPFVGGLNLAEMKVGLSDR